MTTSDPFTGVNSTQQIDNSTIQLTIKNQPFTSSIDNTSYYLYYDIRTKSHFNQDWTDHYPLTYLISDYMEALEPIPYSWFISTTKYGYYNSHCLPASNSSYTTLSFPIKYYPLSTDFQVEAFIGHNYHYFWPNRYPIYPSDYGWRFDLFRSGVVLDTSSNWSDTQTLTYPRITSLLPQGKEFNTASVPLDFVVDQPVYQIMYSTDNQNNVTIAGNTTLSNLSNGLHNVTVYARGKYTGEIGSSETIYFTVATSQTFSFAPIATISAFVLVLAIVGLLVYWKKRKR